MFLDRLRISPVASRLRLPLLLCALLVPAAPAAASTVYYASPGGAGTTCTQALPCPLQYAVAHIGTSGDAILAEDGKYSISSPLDVRAGMTLAGEHTGGATLNVANIAGASVTVESGATLRDLHLYASQGPTAVRLLGSTTLLRADVRGIQDACEAAGSPVTIQDSVCDSTSAAADLYDAVSESSPRSTC
jgi:hypothetical protein